MRGRDCEHWGTCLSLLLEHNWPSLSLSRGGRRYKWIHIYQAPLKRKCTSEFHLAICCGTELCKLLFVKKSTFDGHEIISWDLERGKSAFSSHSYFLHYLYYVPIFSFFYWEALHFAPFFPWENTPSLHPFLLDFSIPSWFLTIFLLP